MNTTLNTADWIQDRGDYPGHQQQDLHDGYQAKVWPLLRGWSWTILDGENTDLDGGWTRGEDEAKAAVADWAEADLMVAQITGDLLSAAFTAYGHTREAVDRAELAVAHTTQIRR